MVTMRNFEPGDAEAVSVVIRETMRISNSRDYSSDILEPLIEYFSPAKVRQLNLERYCLVAEIDNRIIGTIAFENAELYTFFVHPEFQGKSVGSRLLKAIEKIAETEGIRMIKVGSSLTAVSFYEKNGYRKTGVEKETTAGRQIELEKVLS